MPATTAASGWCRRCQPQDNEIGWLELNVGRFTAGATWANRTAPYRLESAKRERCNAIDRADNAVSPDINETRAIVEYQ